MARGQFNIWIPSNTEWGKFDWVPTTDWQASDAADDVLVRLGLTSGRGLTNFYNKFVKPIVVDKFTAIWNVASGYLQATTGGLIPVSSFSSVLNNGMTTVLKTNGIESLQRSGFFIYVSPENINTIVDAITPILSNKNTDHSILMKRLHEGMIYRLEKLKSMEFESSEGKSALIHVLAIQTIIKRGIFDGSVSNFFDSGDVNITASEDYQKFVYGLINPKFTRKNVAEICNFLAAFKYTDDQVEYDRWKLEFENYKANAVVNAQTSKPGIEIAAFGIGLLTFFLRKGV